MDWARLDLRMPNQASVNDQDREIIRQLAEEVIIKSDHDPDVVLNAAASAMSRRDVVVNLRAYAARTIFRAIKRTADARAKKDPLVATASLDVVSNFAGNDSIENTILVRELLDKLAPQDREIFVRKMEGETFPEIDGAMSLRPRTAEFRFRVCKTTIREALSVRFDPGKSLRGR